MWGGRAPVRTVLYMGTLVATRYTPRIKAFYERLRAAGKGKNVALTACMHKFWTILNAMLTQRTPWPSQEVHGEKIYKGALDNQDSCSAALRLPGAAHRQRSAFALSGGMPCNTIRDMKIYEFIWPEERVAHIARHGVRPEEVEEVCFGRALVQRTKSAGANPVYYVLGQTAAGRYLFCVVIRFPDGKGFPVTARPMTRQEQRRFNQWKNR